MEKNQNDRLDTLTHLLAKVQNLDAQEEFIYGVTPRTGRGVLKRLNDFLIDVSAVPLTEKGYFFELLATMIRAGIPLNRALVILQTKTDNRRLRRVIATIAFEIEHGRPLSQALDLFPKIFTESERGIIRSAEAVGNLEHVLFKIADSLERQQGIRTRLAAALVYPAVVSVALIISIIIMLVIVVPRMQALFATSSLSLPLATQILLGVSLWLSTKWWLVMTLLLFCAGLFHIYTHSEEGRFSWDFHKLRIPFIGGILRKVYVLRFVDTLGLLIESGLPINKALEYVAGTIGNEVYRVKTFAALAAVQLGQPLSRSLANAPFLFPETVTNMIGVGEQAASLGDLSTKIGSHYRREIDHTLKQLTTILGPLLILIIGAAVSFFAIAILSPIFSLTQSVQ